MIDRLTVCGLGKLGSPIAASFAVAGAKVLGFDLDGNKIKAILNGQAPVQEPGLQDAISTTRHRFTATPSEIAAVAWSDACIFVTPTPSLPDGSFDNAFLLDGVLRMAGALPEGNKPYLFIIASTVTPNTCQNILYPAIAAVCKRKFHLVYKPELIAIGTVMRDLANPDLAIIGAEDPWAIEQTEILYRRIAPRAPMHSMPWTEAELAKISLNCAITMKISFANQVAMVAERMNVNPHRVLRAVGQDSRIGSKAMKPGLPFGGPCFPRDNRMFRFVAERAGVSPHLARATDQINDDRLDFILSQVPADGDVGILGLAYKNGTGLTEESAGVKLRNMLLAQGRTVKAHDSRIASDKLECVMACKAIIIATSEPEYRTLTFARDTFLIDPMGLYGEEN